MTGHLRAALVGALTALAVACGASQPTPVQQVDVGTWATQDALCVSDAPDRAHADACRDALRFVMCHPDGGLLADSGACANVRLSDGGTP